MKRRKFLAALALIPFINPEKLVAKVVNKPIVKYFSIMIPKKTYNLKFQDILEKNIPNIIKVEILIPVKINDLYEVRGAVSFITQNSPEQDIDLTLNLIYTVVNLYEEFAYPQVRYAKDHKIYCKCKIFNSKKDYYDNNYSVSIESYYNKTTKTKTGISK